MATLTWVLTLALFTANSAVEVFEAQAEVPAVITTWNFENASRKAWELIFEEKRSAVDAVEAGCTVCEYEQCGFTVGYGGSPDENGETTLDAMIMDGETMNVGAVGGLRRIKNAVGVARKVLDNTKHSFLVGELATRFAVDMGFREESLETDRSRELYRTWRNNECQPNFRTRVLPDPSKHCGPYRPASGSPPACPRDARVGEDDHDTIGMVAVDSRGHVASGTSTNGARHKVPGRVGDSPIAGAGSFADDEVGGAAATGDGDVMMRFLPSLLAVEAMRGGQGPREAARAAVERIGARHPGFQGAVVALRKDGAFGAACSGMPTFPYCVATPATGETKVLHVTCE